MKNLSLFVFLFLLGMISSCKKESVLANGKDFKLDYEYTVTFNNDELQIHFDELLEDSRCPPLALCQWPGRAKVRIITTAKGVEKEYEFTTLAPIHMDTIFENGNDRYQFELLEVNPFPDGIFHSPEAYSIEFNLKKL